MLFKTQSKLIEKNTQNKELEKAFDKKFISLKLGRRVECGMHLYWLKEPIQTIQKGKDTYYVSDATFFSTEQSQKLGEDFTQTHAFLVKKDKNFSSVYIISRATHAGALFKDQRSEFVIDGETIPLNDKTDIYDLYDVRFQLRNNKKARQFFDDFLIVDSVMRKHYKLYETQHLYREKRTNILQRKIQGRQRA